MHLKTVRALLAPRLIPWGETDCITGLYANVYRPAGVTEKSKLPVVVVSPLNTRTNAVMSSDWVIQWFFGGAFADGDASPYDGSTVIKRSVELGEPVIYVNFNYRVNAFGWLGGKEALAGGAANVGLHDRGYRFADQQLLMGPDLRPFQSKHRWVGIYQKSSSWLGLRLISPGSAVIQKRSLCESFFLQIITRNRSLCAHRSAGAIAQDLSPSPPTSSQPPTSPHSGLLSLYEFPISRLISRWLKVLFAVVAIRLHGPNLQDRQPETPSHLRPLGAAHRMRFVFGYFGMSPCCPICQSHSCHQHYSRIAFSQRSGFYLGNQH